MEDLIIGAVNGSDATNFKKLKEGKMRIALQADLHGYSLFDARIEFYELIKSAYLAKQRVILVITGKGNFGGGFIKNDIKNWMNDPDVRPLIITVCHAPSEMGGAGALLFLLKKQPQS